MSDREIESDEDVAIITKKKDKTKSPQMYKVILLNDDYTTMDFVVYVLKTVFQKSTSDATRIMLNVHRQGRGVCGMYPKQIAETKVVEVHDLAKSEGHPLRCIMEIE